MKLESLSLNSGQSLLTRGSQQCKREETDGFTTVFCRGERINGVVILKRLSSTIEAAALARPVEFSCVG